MVFFPVFFQVVVGSLLICVKNNRWVLLARVLVGVLFCLCRVYSFDCEGGFAALVWVLFVSEGDWSSLFSQSG